MAEKKPREYNEGKIVLFPNTDKEGKQPDFKGWGMFKGEKFELSIWNNVSQAGNDYKSGDVQEPYVAPQKVETKPVETETEIDF